LIPAPMTSKTPLPDHPPVKPIWLSSLTGNPDQVDIHSIPKSTDHLSILILSRDA
jgi:hypothetical protein